MSNQNPCPKSPISSTSQAQIQNCLTLLNVIKRFQEVQILEKKTTKDKIIYLDKQ